ncbi:hypothetical protein MOPEL_134_00460 [Mobilicoccus pelagius NBRC 104925]|uniref:Uncharacterized protein n=2 Tax=Mobilicoccus TaxID=984996 RepID=H5UVK4_9MICO|nr:hypothetical protein MOPEL_134_00460 [Mobilicoccus pelagius NBRC 104925]
MTTTSGTDLDPRTPVIVGVGEASERLGEPGCAGLSPVALAAAAAQAALTDAAVAADTGDASQTSVVDRLARDVDVVAFVRPFEDSGLEERSPLGRADNAPRAVARRVGADPVRAVLGVGGGQSPHDLVVEFAAEIAAGRAKSALVVGAEALSSSRHWSQRPAEDRPHWTETVGGDLEDRGPGLADMTSPRQAALGLDHAPPAYALFENARRARLGLPREAYARTMGELFAPFTEVAATNPHAAAPTRRSAEELVTVTERNRLVAEPYPRFVVARDQVNQGAAVLLTSLGRARDLGLDPSRFVFCHGHASVKERPLMERADLSTSPAVALAVGAALDEAGLAADDLDVLDVYSCFPIAVTVVREALGFAPDDPRGFTVTGGLPFFGGPGNDYALHSLAQAAARLRERPGTKGLVTANGGILSSQSMGVWSSAPALWRPGRDDALAAEVASWEAPRTTDDPRGAARVETFTVVHDRDGSRRGLVVGRLDDGDLRFLARAADDPATWALLDADQPVGAAMVVGADGLVRAAAAETDASS